MTVPSEFVGKNGRRYHHALPQRWSADLGRVLGWLVGDGWLRTAADPRVGFAFGPEDDAALERIAGVMTPWFGRPVKVWTRARGVRHLMYPGKFFSGFFESLGVRPVGARDKTVPATLFRAPRPAVVGFLQGLFSADGTVRENPKTNSSWIALTSKSRELLRGVQLLLLNLGIKSSVMDRSRPPREGLFPYRTKAGELRSYGSDGVLFELGIFGKSRGLFLREIGFLDDKQRRLEPVRYAGSYAQKWSDPVAAVVPAGPRAVYDLTEPQSHSMIANGFVVHQCGEQPLLPNDACNLGSVNVAKFAVERAGRWELDWGELERVVRLAVRFLDDVIEVNPYPLEQVDEMVKANRRVGLGVMGWADLLFTLGIPYDSEDALELAERLMAFVEDKGHDQSARLAEERGPFPHWGRSIYRHGRPLRNATVTTIAPTGTISMIAGCSSGIEPVFALAFEHRVKGADGERVLPFFSETFERLARRQGFHTETLMTEVARRGSLAGVEGVPAAAREVFKTAHEIDAIWHVRHQAAFQKHTDNGVSKTINLPESATEADVAAAYRQAWDLGCLGITVFRDGSKGSQVLNIGLRGPGAAADAAPARRQAAAAQPHRGHLPDGDADRDRLHHRQRQRRRRALRGLRAGGQGGIGHHGGGGGPRPARLARAAAALSAVAAAAARGGDQPALLHRRRPADRLRRGQGALAPGRARANARRAHRDAARDASDHDRAGAGRRAAPGGGSLPRVRPGHAGVRGRVQEVSLLRVQRVLGGGHVLGR